MPGSRDGLAAVVPAPLPVELTSFIGRARELEELRALLPGSRLLTLTGAGGSGKTRIALELARAETPVAWASLAAVEDAAHIARVVAEAFGIREEVAGRGADALIRLLRDRAGLLVLDNCEHLVDACAALADTVLRGCADLRILATSREPLGVAGERAWLVPPLSLPAADEARDPAGSLDLGTFEAVRLFVERAREVHPSFELTLENRAAVAEVCLRLDGIPLAIELSAARVRLMSPSQIRDRLDDTFRVLGSGGRSAPPRHRTLRAAIDWSHDLLTAPERALLRRLAVFRGGFDLDAVEALVPDADSKDAAASVADVLDLLGRLVDRSLVLVREQAAATRYDLLETVRQYGLARLTEAGEEHELRRRHARWMLARALEAEPWLTRRERPLWVGRLLADLDNLREALAWSRDHEPHLHVQLVGALWWFWFSTQHWTEARQWIENALALPTAASPDIHRARLLFAAGALGSLQGRGAGVRDLLEEAIALARAGGDPRLAAYTTNYLGMTYAGAGDPRGEACCTAAADWFRAHDDLYGLRLALLLLGSTAAHQGRTREGEAYNAEGVAVARRFGLPRELAISLQNLAVVHLVERDFARAEPLLREALAASLRDPSYFFIATGLGYLAETVGALGRPLEAARLLGAAEAARESIGARPFPLDGARMEAAVPRFREAAGLDAFERVRAEGRGLGPLAAIEYGLSMPAAADTAIARPAAPESASRQLEVRILGPLQVRAEGRTLDASSWKYAKPKELLVWLLLERRGGTRDEIGAHLWSDATPAQLKNSFHVTLHHLRKTLGNAEWVVAEGGRYRLAPSLTVELDTDRFEHAARGALRAEASVESLRDALALYTDDLLAGEPTGPWLADHRDRLRALHVAVAMELGRRLEESGDPAAAADVYHGVARREDLNEEIHRRLMSCWARAGDRARALRWYDRLVETLSGTLDTDPEPETTRLVEGIRRSA